MWLDVMCWFWTSEGVLNGKAWALRLNLLFVYLFVVMQIGSRFDRLGFLNDFGFQALSFSMVEAVFC